MDEKIYFMPGDLVTVRLNIPNKPVMVVDKKETLTVRPSKEDIGKSEFFVGIKCWWFDTNKVLQKAIFNTKDLEKVTE